VAQKFIPVYMGSAFKNKVWLQLFVHYLKVLVYFLFRLQMITKMIAKSGFLNDFNHESCSRV
jgi:hypothetical protein